MSTLRMSIWQVGILGLACLSTRSVIGQPPTAAWVGASRNNPDYAFPANWIDAQTGEVLTVAPDADTSVFFRFEAGQAPRDPEGNVLVALRQDDLAAERMAVQVLPFRFFDGGTLTVGEQAATEQGVLIVENGGMLTLENATLDIRDSAFVGGGPFQPAEMGTISILPEGRLDVGDTLRIWDSGDTTVQLEGGSLRAGRIDSSPDPQRFQWFGGQLSFDEFLGDLVNPFGLLNPGEQIGVANVLGNYSQLSGGTLAIELGGTDLGQTYDHLAIGGNLAAGGSLAVSLVGDFVPSAGAEFDVLDFMSLQGRFAEVVLPQLPSGLGWDTSGLHTEGVLRVFDAVIPVLWTGAAGDGDYFNPENWQPELVPVDGDELFALTIPQGADVTIPSTELVRVSRLMQAEGSVIEVEERAAFDVEEESTLSGTISVVGRGASFAAAGTSVQLVGAPRFLASSGGEIRLIADQYDVTDDPGSSTLIAAEGPDSLVDLPRMEVLSVGVASDSTFTVAATDGGEVDLSGLTTISGVTDGAGRLVLRADSGGRLRLGASTVTAQTTLEATGPDTTVLVDGGLILEPATEVRLDDGATIALAAPLYNRGTITGNGTFRGVVFNDGLMSPGNSIGELGVEGDLIATESSVFSIEIIAEMMAAPENDRFMATERIMLAGTLLVMLIEGGMGVFTPVEGDEFELFTAGSGISGKFASIRLPALPAEFGWKLLYEPMAVSMKVVERLPGDFDADGDVDRDDLLIWQAGVGLMEGASQTDGDSDGDQDVDGHDLLQYLVNFSNTSAGALASTRGSVPEPNAASLGVLAAAIAFWTARSGRFGPRGRRGNSTRTGA